MPPKRICGNAALRFLHGTGNLRLHSRCYYRQDEHSPTETWLAMIAAVTDLSGAIAGAHRTWLARDGFGKPRAHVILCNNVKIFARAAGTLVGACRSGGLFVMREQT